MSDWFDYLNYDPSDFGSGNVGGDYNPDVVSTPSLDYSDPEILKLVRQQDRAQTGEPSLAGLGGDTSQSIPLVDVSGGGNWFEKFVKGAGSAVKGMGGKALDFAQTPQGIMAILAALLAQRDRPRASGGGTAMAYAGPKQMQRTMVQGKYGPIAQYAAQGGIMHAYAQGGAVRPFPMQDGGFVMTKRAVDGAGGMQGMQQRIPEAVPIRGPGHGTSDSIPAFIQGSQGVTPAKVSNGEMYVPPGRNTNGLYALMRAMERKA